MDDPVDPELEDSFSDDGPGRWPALYIVDDAYASDAASTPSHSVSYPSDPDESSSQAQDLSNSDESVMDSDDDNDDFDYDDDGSQDNPDGNEWLEDADEDDQEEGDTTSLHAAANRGDAEAMEQLLVGGNGDVDCRTRATATTPLHLACRWGHTQPARLLLAAGANIEAEKTGTRSRPLHEATAWGHLPVMQLLVEAGADVTAAAGPHNNTVFHLAAINDHADVLRYLLQSGKGSAWEFNSAGKLPLMLALKEDATEAAEVLLQDLERMDGSESDDDAFAAAQLSLLCLDAAIRYRRVLLLPRLLRIKGPCDEEDAQDLLQEARERGIEDELFVAVCQAWSQSLTSRALQRAQGAFEEQQQRERAQLAAEKRAVQQLIIQAAGLMKNAQDLQQQARQPAEAQAPNLAAPADGAVGGAAAAAAGSDQAKVLPGDGRKGKRKKGWKERQLQAETGEQQGQGQQQVGDHQSIQAVGTSDVAAAADAEEHDAVGTSKQHRKHTRSKHRKEEQPQQQPQPDAVQLQTATAASPPLAAAAILDPSSSQKKSSKKRQKQSKPKRNQQRDAEQLEPPLQHEQGQPATAAAAADHSAQLLGPDAAAGPAATAAAAVAVAAGSGPGASEATAAAALQAAGKKKKNKRKKSESGYDNLQQEQQAAADTSNADDVGAGTGHAAAGDVDGTPAAAISSGKPKRKKKKEKK